MPCYYPEKCLRNCSFCRPLALIESDGPEHTFICMGENDGTRRVAQDRYTLCIKSAEGVDTQRFLDRRDWADQMTVMAQARTMLELEALEEGFVPAYGPDASRLNSRPINEE